MIWVTTAALCVAAYTLGRTRPLARARDWAAWQIQLLTTDCPGWRSRALLAMALHPDLLARVASVARPRRARTPREAEETTDG